MNVIYIWTDICLCCCAVCVQELYYEDRHYHEHCFSCSRCRCSLADKPFSCQEDALVCNDCYCNEFSSKCVACGKTVMPGTVPKHTYICYFIYTTIQKFGVSKIFFSSKENIFIMLQKIYILNKWCIIKMYIFYIYICVCVCVCVCIQVHLNELKWEKVNLFQ